MQIFRLLNIIALAIFAVAFVSCGSPANDYSEYHNIPSGAWRYGDTIRFAPTHPDSIAQLHLAVGVRHANTFRFSSLWLEITTTNPGGAKRIDTLSLQLADHFGRWRGQGIGPTFQLTDTLPSPISHRSGSPVTIRHIMRADTLEGVNQIGIFLF